MMFFPNPSRRRFVETTAAAAELPRSPFASGADCSYWFIDADTLQSWPVADPVAWSLENASQPVLERATEGLLKLTADEGDRIIRLVVRRCRLNLLELRPGQVVVHHWGQQGVADLRRFFKAHRLAGSRIKVVLRDRKRENSVTTRTGDQFLFGVRVTARFPLDLYLRKWASRCEQEPDDWQAAPLTWSGYAWEGIESNRIPWAALKSAWRRASPLICQNCNTPTILINFGYPFYGMFNRDRLFLHVCGTCRRKFEDCSIESVTEWMNANLDEEVRPQYDMIWDHRKPRRTL
jgi:hypothetical protein